MKTLSAIFYLILFVCGVWCVKDDNLPGAIFFGLAWGCENIAVSIDHWPRVRIWEHLKKMAEKDKKDSQ